MSMMTKVELKNKLKEKIEEMEDIALIEEILGVIEIENDQVYVLNKEQKKAIDKAQKQFENGEYFTNDEVIERTKQWLGE